ncbi:WD40/YVTN/BNR-like repeat-containing protein [Natrarchaeobius oligotrophus]|uniref:Uncharacterized protein n=1 Tax=Natrarchaeobius chitinivorans TaxID=1679083 RepID=A0A3N6N064_NATCH|nr:hypothetical protein [Natrarchaeobius chitinivorans]RQH00827.1 hypothetical protein EA472_09330 [Natrarchaeobius chitinivorans]
MSTRSARRSDDGFVPFFRRYTKTWVHAVATAGLTAFGTLTIVHRWFVVLALASYVVPPLALYVGGAGTPSGDVPADEGGESRRKRDEGERGREAERNRSQTAAREDSRNELERTTDRDATEREGARERGRSAAREPNGVGNVTGGDGADDGGGESASPTDGGGFSSEDGSSADEGGEAPTDDDAAVTEGDDSVNWEPIDAPVETTLTGAVVTESGAAYAVGGGGVVVSDDGTDSWSVVLEDGPAAAGDDLRGADATDDGAIVWVAGDGGALGRLDVDSGRHVDYTAPRDRTDNLLGVAVGGPAGDETVLLINGSGEVLRGRYRDGDLEWNEPVKPGGGSSLSGVVLAGGSTGYCCDTNDGAFRTDDGGESFERIGLEGANGTLTGVATDDEGTPLLCADDGVVHRFDGATWTPERVADAEPSGISSAPDRIAVCGTDGAVHERPSDGTEWERVDAAGGVSLRAVSLGRERGVAVGEAGAILERRRR